MSKRRIASKTPLIGVRSAWIGVGSTVSCSRKLSILLASSGGRWRRARGEFRSFAFSLLPLWRFDRKRLEMSQNERLDYEYVPRPLAVG